MVGKIKDRRGDELTQQGNIRRLTCYIMPRWHTYCLEADTSTVHEDLQIWWRRHLEDVKF